MRFGDGDMFLAKGQKDILHAPSTKLTYEMNEALSYSSGNILKSLPIHSYKFGYEDGMAHGSHLMRDKAAERFIKQSIELFIGQKIYSTVALHHQFVTNYEYALTFLRFLKSRSMLFIGCKDIESTILTTLFGKVPHIQCPSKESYTEIDRIEEESIRALSHPSSPSGVVIVAMGCPGRVLVKRLLKRNLGPFFYFDFGSLLDFICGWNTRTWHTQAGISHEVVSRIFRTFCSSQPALVLALP